MGWLLIASGLFHLGTLIADWFLGRETIELGFLTIPAGIALLQYHQFTAKLLGIFCFVAGALIASLFLFPDGAALPLWFSLFSIILLVGLGFLLLRSLRHFDTTSPSFNPRLLPQSHAGPIVALVALGTVATLGYHQVEKQKMDFASVREFQLVILPFDSQTGAPTEGGLLYRLDRLDSPGFAREKGFTTVPGGAKYLFYANPPLKVHLSLTTDQNITTPVSITLEGKQRFKSVTVPLQTNSE